jgi:sucrose-6-phosphate hydrolase SacC (GH32 family)
MFQSNRTIWRSAQSAEEREFVTLEYIGSLPVTATELERSTALDGPRVRSELPPTRVLLNNPYFARGSTEFFIGRQANGSAFETDADEPTSHSMLDWGLFARNETATERGARGIDALSHDKQLPTGGAWRMARVLGGRGGDKMMRRGRRVAVAWVDGVATQAGTADPQGRSAALMSLPRDLSLEPAGASRSDRPAPLRLLQQFSPELKQLRRNRTSLGVAGGADEAFGQQVEICATFSASQGIRRTTQQQTPEEPPPPRNVDFPADSAPFGISVLGRGPQSRERTVVSIDPVHRLVCVDGTAQGNGSMRCGPYEERASDRGRATMHVYVDHSIIEVIVNNITALTVSVAPSGPGARRVALHGVVPGMDAAADVWELLDAEHR